MMDSGNRSVITGFDSARPIGEELGSKAGTVDWELGDVELSAPENISTAWRKSGKSFL
jgi:hypothetical protein